MGVRGLDHVNLRAPAELVERLRRFYVEVIGLHEGHRPVFRSGSRGYWLYAGTQAVMHLTITAEGDGQPQRAGWLGHYAFACDDLAATRARLDAAGIPYQVDRVDSPGQVQLFLSDPSGLAVELNFSTDKR
ncbi:VOC family protein [Dyella soli]|uniref:Diguanylate cyclase n=1 Tax=Dyella soli TaxID=522319 RepID=A0A4R0YVN1_9GAMM|nr:VOC family protein [Dyella soli]TCI09514.1 diguanylate cyclase [Dyella soli]